MDYCDEHYVKLYTRDTPTWRLWPWQARALFPLLIRRLDKAGTIDLGTRAPLLSLAVIVELPEEVVVKPGLDALIADGTVELNGGTLVVPNFLAAQEARKTRAAVARDHREKKRVLARVKASGLLEHRVTDRDRALPRVTESDPPAQPDPQPDPSPTPAQPDPQIDLPIRKPSDWESIYREMMLSRDEQAERLAIEKIPDEAHSPAYINASLKRIAERGNLDMDGLLRIYDDFLELPWAADKKPPFAFRVFASEKVWRPLLDKRRAA